MEPQCFGKHCFTCLFVCLFVCLPQTGIIFSIEGFEYYKITNKTEEAKFALLQFLFCRFFTKRNYIAILITGHLHN